MNCLEWLPIYFGILKTGAVAVPMNYRYTAEEIEYCLKLSEADALVFGPEFIGRIEAIADRIPQVDPRFFVGRLHAHLRRELLGVGDRRALRTLRPWNWPMKRTPPSTSPPAPPAFPRPSCTTIAASCPPASMEQNHHGQTREDRFLCIPPLYHTGAKMHWFGSLLSGSRAVLLRGVKPEWILQAVSDERHHRSYGSWSRGRRTSWTPSKRAR